MHPPDHNTETFGPALIWQARQRLHGQILRTPLLHSPALSRLTGCELYLKMECWQLCGCFKVRGAINMVSTLSPEERARGLITTSSGNHGYALSHAASILGRPPTTVFMPENADPNKARKIQMLGGTTIFRGANFLKTVDHALAYCEETGGTYVHSHAYPLIIAGQGTIGLEILEDLPDLDVILAQIGGGGLISGIATAIRAAAQDVRIIGVEPTAAPGAYLSFKDGVARERIELQPSVADGLLGGLSPLPYEIIRDKVEKIVLVEESEIIEAMRVFQREEQLMLEGGAVVGLAALLARRIDLQGQRVVLVLTGRNIDSQRYNSLMSTS